MEKKRYLEFDIARTLTLILMPMAHLAESCKNAEMVTEEVYLSHSGVLQIASFGVIVFMMMLGVNILVSSHNTPKELALRALKTLLLGVALNVVRYLIPGLLSIAIREDTSLYEMGIYYSIASDILYFAALCFLFFALARLLKISSIGVLVIGAVLSLISNCLPHLEVSNELLKALLGNFIHIDATSCFSLDQWLITVCIGYAFGDLYINIDKKNKLDKLNKMFIALSPILAGVCLLICYLTKSKLLDHIGSEFLDYRLSLLGVSFLTAVFLFLEGILYFVSKRVKNEKLISFFTVFSKGITAYYFIQWTLVIWVLLIFGAIGYGENGLYIGNGLYLVIEAIIVLGSYFLTMFFMNRKGKKGSIKA